MNKLDIVEIKQLAISDETGGGAVITAVTTGKVNVEIHLSLKAFAALEVMLAAGAVQQGKHNVSH